MHESLLKCSSEEYFGKLRKLEEVARNFKWSDQDSGWRCARDLCGHMTEGWHVVFTHVNVTYLLSKCVCEIYLTLSCFHSKNIRRDMPARMCAQVTNGTPSNRTLVTNGPDYRSMYTRRYAERVLSNANGRFNISGFLADDFPWL